MHRICHDATAYGSATTGPVILFTAVARRMTFEKRLAQPAAMWSWPFSWRLPHNPYRNLSCGRPLGWLVQLAALRSS